MTEPTQPSGADIQFRQFRQSCPPQAETRMLAATSEDGFLTNVDAGETPPSAYQTHNRRHPDSGQQTPRSDPTTGDTVRASFPVNPTQFRTYPQHRERRATIEHESRRMADVNAETIRGALEQLRGVLRAIDAGELTASSGAITRLEAAIAVLEAIASPGSRD